MGISFSLPPIPFFPIYIGCFPSAIVAGYFIYRFLLDHFCFIPPLPGYWGSYSISPPRLSALSSTFFSSHACCAFSISNGVSTPRAQAPALVPHNHSPLRLAARSFSFAPDSPLFLFSVLSDVPSAQELVFFTKESYPFCLSPLPWEFFFAHQPHPTSYVFPCFILSYLFLPAYHSF